MTGAVTHYLEDEHERSISLYRTPTAIDTLKMTVRRLFKDSVSWATISAEATPTTAFTDIPDYYQKALVFGAVSLAYRKRDSDTLNMDFAKEAEQALELEVGPKVPFIQHEQERLSANLWRSKSVNEVLQNRRAQTENNERARERVTE